MFKISYVSKLLWVNSGDQCWARSFNDDTLMKRYDSGPQIFQYETKSVNLKNVLYKSWDWDFLNWACKAFLWSFSIPLSLR